MAFVGRKKNFKRKDRKTRAACEVMQRYETKKVLLKN